LAISTVETSTPVGCRGAAPRRDAEGGEQNQNDGGRGYKWFVFISVGVASSINKNKTIIILMFT